jgi:hypothetical protein
MQILLSDFWHLTSHFAPWKLNKESKVKMQINFAGKLDYLD